MDFQTAIGTKQDEFKQTAFPAESCCWENVCKAAYRLRDTGCFVSRTVDRGRFFVRRTLYVKLNRIGENSEVRTRRIAIVEGVGHKTFLSILKNLQLKLYRLQRAGALEDVDCEQRRAFCLFFYIELQLNRTCFVVY